MTAKNRLAGLPKGELDKVFEEQKKVAGKAGNPDYKEFWVDFDKRALTTAAKIKAIKI